MEAVTDIDPGFKLDSDIYTLDNTVYFDIAKKTMAPSGKLMVDVRLPAGAVDR